MDRFAQTEIYRSLGIRLLPLHAGEKTPAIRNWQRRATTDIEKHRKWFGNAMMRNIGALCDRIAVVDTDSEANAHWWERNMPETPWRVRTRSGTHYYYEAEGLALGNRTHVRLLKRQHSPTCDLRAGGNGYVVAAHMIVRGHVYQLLGEITLDLPRFNPDWLPTRDIPRPIIAHAENQRLDRRAQLYGATIRAISGESGHNATFRYVCWMRDTLSLPPDRALAQLICWNASGNAKPPWSEAELRHKIESAYNINL